MDETDNRRVFPLSFHRMKRRVGGSKLGPLIIKTAGKISTFSVASVAKFELRRDGRDQIAHPAPFDSCKFIGGRNMMRVVAIHADGVARHSRVRLRQGLPTPVDPTDIKRWVPERLAEFILNVLHIGFTGSETSGHAGILTGQPGRITMTDNAGLGSTSVFEIELEVAG